MRVGLKAALSDANVDARAPNNQRQLAISVEASASTDLSGSRSVPLNLCLILDHSGSMGGRPLKTVKQAAQQLVDRLNPGDRLSVVVFDHRAKVIVSNDVIDDPRSIKRQIDKLRADGGTAIDEGLRLGIEELGKGKKDTVSQAFLLTDGENEHGSNDKCLKFAKLATEYNLTLNTLGFGAHWNQDILEAIADAGGGTMAYIERPDQAVDEFGRLFNRIQSVGLTNAYLRLSLMPKVRLAELKPIAQVSPDAIELPVQREEDDFVVRLGDLMTGDPRVALANIYISQLPLGSQTIAQVQIEYDDPAFGREGLRSETLRVEANVVSDYKPAINPEVQPHVLALAKYRQTKLAETRLQQGDRSGAATLLQTAAKTALQMGDRGAATVLQENATRLQSGEELSDEDKKKTRIVSKTILQ
ncbi:MAG: VWA domain-containing protein [Hormoscilla sp. GUM202]|nr:VWA domain-containing protein [Hormoscilla sp. GUM202]